MLRSVLLLIIILNFYETASETLSTIFFTWKLETNTFKLINLITDVATTKAMLSMWGSVKGSVIVEFLIQRRKGYLKIYMKVNK